MKKIIITRSQLNKLNEDAVNIMAKAGGNTTSDYINTVSKPQALTVREQAPLSWAWVLV